MPGIPETLLSGIQSGIRYVRHSAALRALLVRNMSFSFCASALWALLPVIARDEFAMGAGGYGLLLGVFGAGAVIGAVSLPRHLQRISLNALVNAAVLVFATASVLVAATPILSIAILSICAAGAAWVSVLASLSGPHGLPGQPPTQSAWVTTPSTSVSIGPVRSP